MPRFFIIFILILSAALGLLGFWYYQRNIYSKEILKVEVLGPETSQALQEAEYIVRYKNNGDIALEDVRLIFEYPENSVLAEGLRNREARTLEDIYPGQENTTSFRARLLGGEGQSRTANVYLSYRPKNLKARYESQTSHTTVISSVPLALEIDVPSRIEASRPFSIAVNYFSNSEYPVSKLRLSLEYPPGFTFIDSQPKGLAKNEWEIGLLNRTEGGRIEVKGSLDGEAYQQKNFKARLGIWDNGNFVLLKEITRAVSIAPPSIYISQTINGSPNYIADAGDLLHYEIFFRNAGESVFENLFLVVKLGGNAFDLTTIRAEDGSFQSGDNSILWDWQVVPRLRFFTPGEEGKVEFWVRLKEDLSGLSDGPKNLSVKDTVVLSQVRQTFDVKIKAKLGITQSVYHQDEIFGNQGAIPPKVGETTTYTVVWRVRSWHNDVEDVRVRAVLPDNVKITGKIFPENARLTFDSASREIVWEVGRVEPGVGGDSAYSSAFQIALTPSAGDAGKAALLITQVGVSGTDQWTGAALSSSAPTIDTNIPDDHSLSGDRGTVRP